ncbi:Uncharacterised protein [Listeria grayi]|uniref:Uncharacterized protein n=1 Tax=Listeria grayi TaxID=1641 RepID=A0A378MFZ1_LISGR|nr:Uncharacterised protein [Listeria grayi]
MVSAFLETIKIVVLSMQLTKTLLYLKARSKQRSKKRLKIHQVLLTRKVLV